MHVGFDKIECATKILDSIDKIDSFDKIECATKILDSIDKIECATKILDSINFRYDSACFFVRPNRMVHAWHLKLQIFATY